MGTLTYRIVTPAELPFAVELAYKLTLEGPLGRSLYPRTHDDVAARLARLTRLGEMLMAHDGLYAAVTDTGRLVGLLGMAVHEHALTGELVAGEVVWYIEPDYRRGTIGRRLLAIAEDFGRRKICSMLQIAAAHTDSERLRRVYTRRGYEEIETMFIKRLR